MKSLILSLLIVLLFMFIRESYSITIPLYRQKSLREISLTAKGIKDFSVDAVSNASNNSLAIYRYFDSEFYAVIQIGKKARPFNLLVDTAWGHSWVISEDCAYTTIGCWFHNKYDHRKSSTYVKNDTKYILPMGKYNLSGYLSEDVFHLEQLNVTNQTFIEMVHIPYQFLFSKADGVLGLGLKSLANGITPVFYNLVKLKRIKNALFSVYLNRDRQSYRGGNVILGEINQKHILKNHTITYLDIIDSGYWKFHVDRIELNNYKQTFPFCISGCTAIADTSRNEIVGPPLEIEKINRLIGARLLILGRYQVACETINKLPEITFILAGKEFLLKGRDYTQQLSYKSFTLCLSAFTASKSDSWVFGGSFLSEFYSIYDLENQKIGFVKAA